MYGLDVADTGLLRRRSWRWLRRRIEHLLDLAPTWTPDGRPVQATRLGRSIFPTPPPKQQ